LSELAMSPAPGWRHSEPLSMQPERCGWRVVEAIDDGTHGGR
jgi:hypothetical protein